MSIAVKSPAEFVRQFLIDESLVGDHDGEECPSTVGIMPETENEGLIVSFFDTTGFDDGRYMATGDVKEHPGIQIRARCGTYNTAYSKLRAIISALSYAYRETIVITEAPDTYSALLHSARCGPLIPMGSEQIRNRPRWSFSVNVVLTIT